MEKSKEIPLASMENLSVDGSPTNGLRKRKVDTPDNQLSISTSEIHHAPNDATVLTPRTAYFKIVFNEPFDRLNIVFIIFMLHGVGALMPWNMFITAKSYFIDYKLNPNTTTSAAENYRDNFLTYLGVASQVPNVIFSALNVFVQFGGSSFTFRIISSIVIETIIFIITICLAMSDTSTWPGTFFYLTMASVVIINSVNAIYQNSLYGLAAKLPPKYSMAIILGCNASGTLTSILSIISIAASPNYRTAAIYYFISSIFVLLACIDTYYALPLSKYYRYYSRLEEEAIGQPDEVKSSGRPYFKIFRMTWVQCFNVFFVFFVTLTIFPAIHAAIEPVDENFLIPVKYFVPVTCYLFFNFFAMIGSLIPNWIQWPGPKYLWIPVVLRVLMIPYFMLCNYKPHKRQIPVIINNDWAYIAMGVFMALTSGYFSSLAMMYAPECVGRKHASMAGMMAALFLVFGILVGVNFTFFVNWLVVTKGLFSF